MFNPWPVHGIPDSPKRSAGRGRPGAGRAARPRSPVPCVVPCVGSVLPIVMARPRNSRQAQSRGLPEDLDLLLEPPVLALEPLQLGLLGLARGQRLRRAGRQVLVAPPAQLAGAQPQLGRDLAQPLAAVQQAPDRLGPELGGEPPPLLPLPHPALLGCSGSLANPPLLRGQSTLLGLRGHGSAVPRPAVDRTVPALAPLPRLPRWLSRLLPASLP